LRSVATPAGTTYLRGVATPAGTAYLRGITTPAGTAYLGICWLISNCEKLEQGDGEELEHVEDELLGLFVDAKFTSILVLQKERAPLLVTGIN
jgi:hypothetical protein